MRLMILSLVSAWLLVPASAGADEMVPYSQRWDVELKRLSPREVLDKLDLNHPGLERVKAAAEKGERDQALAELLAYYRAKFPPPRKGTATKETLKTADDLCRHIFHWGPYAPADYGDDIDWAIDPADDIEWVAAVYRFYWADDLRDAWIVTRDEKYARTFVELATDWIEKHPLEEWTRSHHVYTGWKGFAWLDLQTGIRASKAVDAFKAMIHAEAMTPEFLATFLASLYDHQHKTELIPMGIVHNKAIFEQRGVMNICHTFPEFADHARWARLSLERTTENLLAQVTTDGAQREWCGSYHMAVLGDAIQIMQRADDLKLEVPAAYRERVRRMCDYVFAVASPDLAWPMFGDTGRGTPTPPNRTDAQLYAPLASYTELWNDPRYAARADLALEQLPEQTSYAFDEAGMYIMRSEWGPNGVYMALHCVPPGLSGHDQRDNHTFELYAYGRWLLTDTGYYTYGHDREGRNWHRQTRVHQTLTLDNKDTHIDGKLRLWHTSPKLDALVVENASYEGLNHRRTVWFVDQEFFVVLDEAIGDVAGTLRTHWQPAAGPGKLDVDNGTYVTDFPYANVLIKSAYPKKPIIEPEDGWFAWTYGKREPRKTFSVRHPDVAPAAFLTVIAPYRDTSPPEIDAWLEDGFEVGADDAVVRVEAAGRSMRIGRSLKRKTAWRAPGGQAARQSESEASGSARPALRRIVTPSSDQREDEFPAIGIDKQGRRWISWISWNGETDCVRAARIEDGKSRTPVTLSQAEGDHWRPAMATDGEGRLWVTWAQNDDGVWDIWASTLAGDDWSAPIRLTRGEANDFAQKLAVDSKGRLWMTWQSVQDANYEILLATVTPDGLGKPINISHHPANDWEPAIATDGKGGVYVGWDTYRADSYDILVTYLKEGQLTGPTAIAASRDYEAHAALAVDHQDRLWVAWDNGGSHWGLDSEGGRRLHNERSVQLRCLAGGKLFAPAVDLPWVLTGPLGSFCELPELTVDGDGRLWIFVRHLTDLTPGPRPDGRRSQARGIWNPVALCYSGDQWSAPLTLKQSNGRNDMRVRTCLDREGSVWAAWADDGRKTTRAEEPGNHNVHASMLSIPQAARPPAVAPHSVPMPVLIEIERSTDVEPVPPTLNVADHTYVLLYGDTHRHTDISRCGMNHDGSLMDTYRYGMDVARLDFLAISDHDQDLLKHRYGHPESPLQHYAWWRSEKYCDLFFIEETFVPIYAYEHGGGYRNRGGHKNVLYIERGRYCYEDDAPEELFKKLEHTQAVVIPHQLADGGSATDWTKWNPRFERVAEIYQGRGSYEYYGAKPEVSVTREGHYFWDALEMGVRIGVIASSDHYHQREAYAAVYANDLSRRSVMEALRHRRTFGAMDPIIMEFRLGDRLQGEEVEITEPPTFHVRVEASAPITRVQIVKNGDFIHTVEPDTRTVRFDFTDQGIKPGKQAWYYLRCEYGKERYGWSSPIWVGYKPATTE